MPKPQLVAHWRVLWRAWSTRMLALLVALPAVVETMPQGLRFWMEVHLPTFMWLLASIGLISRYVKQFDLGEYKEVGIGLTSSKTEKESIMSSVSITQKFEAGVMNLAKDMAQSLPIPIGPLVSDIIEAVQNKSALDVAKVVQDMAVAFEEYETQTVQKAVESGKVVPAPQPTTAQGA